ncbi:DUF6625 family protein [Vibrio fluvialis]|uniref:DUF6625 family protein n=1 Tax=Vibrio fluvialis TaxID=676 RepID=UPI001F30905B|nr:DUF6625 family protein [Vibrio fluvialis]MCE7602176.1 hypothetical protein [Vibrio fluvialis]
MDIDKKKLVLIVPYFGKLPSWFDLWLRSAKFNREIDFLLFTDCNIESSNNIIVMKMTFSDFVRMCQSKFEFKISLENPYKICDYRPAFGLIFDEYIKKYSHWGHCDTDLIFGDLSNFIDLDSMGDYGRIYTRGHLSIFKNNAEINSLFKSNICISFIDYRRVFNTNYPCHFDEHGGSSLAFIKSEFKVYDQLDFADVYYHNFEFRNALTSNSNDTRLLFSWNNGHLLQYSMNCRSEEIEKDEVAYVHLQKREMSIKVDDITNIDKFSIVPNQFVSFKNEFKKSDFRPINGKFSFYFSYLKRRFKDISFKLNNGYFEYKISWSKNN